MGFHDCRWSESISKRDYSLLVPELNKRLARTDFMPTNNRLSIAAFSVLAILLAITYGAFVWTTDITDFGGDSSGYLLAARYYSPYHVAQGAIMEYKSQIIYPPLFPWLLALVNGGENLLAAHLLVAAFSLAGIGALFVWLRKESLPIWLSASVALIYAGMPATYIQTLNVWTELPFVFFSLAAIAIIAVTESVSYKSWLLAAVLVACATLIRVAALPLLVAFGLTLLTKRPRNCVWIGLVAALPFVFWLIYSSHSEVGAGGYLGQWKEKYALDPMGIFLNQLHSESLALFSAWKYAWLGETRDITLAAVASGFGLICLAAWLCRLKSFKFDALYVAVYLCMLLAWPHPEEALRYSFVLYPILLAYGFMGIYRIAPKQGGLFTRSRVSVGAITALVLVMLPTLIMNVRYFFAVMPDSLDEVKHIPEWYGANRPQAMQDGQFHVRLIEHLKTIEDSVPEGECIFAIKPTVITLYSNRSSYAPPKISEDDNLFDEKMKKCRFAYLLPFASPSYAVPLYPLARLGKRAKLLSEHRLYEQGGPVVGALIEIKPL